MVQVAEPTEENAILMVRGVASVLEAHHRVQVLDEALEAAVRLSHRYIPARQLPDKAVSLLDTACARVAISQHAVPAQLEDCRRTLEALDIELDIIGREEAVGVDVARPPPRGRGEARPPPRRVARSWRRDGSRSASWWTACWRSGRRCAKAPRRSRAPGSALESGASAARLGRRLPQAAGGPAVAVQEVDPAAVAETERQPCSPNCAICRRGSPRSRATRR